MTRNALIEAGAISELSVRLRTKIYYRTLYTVHKKSYKDLLLMNDDISIHQNHLQFFATEILKSANNMNLQFMCNYFSFKPILYELTKLYFQQRYWLDTGLTIFHSVKVY